MSNNIKFALVLSDTKSFTSSLDALHYLRSLFPIEKFVNRIPAIIWRHQLYALFSNRTEIDKQVVRDSKLTLILI
jgi:hypothetical protein